MSLKKTNQCSKCVLFRYIINKKRVLCIIIGIYIFAELIRYNLIKRVN